MPIELAQRTDIIDATLQIVQIILEKAQLKKLLLIIAIKIL